MIKKRLRGPVEAAVVILSFATIAGFVGSLFWLVDLFAHFRVQYLSGAMVTSVALFFLGSHRFAIAALCVAGVNLVMILPFYFGSAISDSDVGPKTAMLLNVNTHSGSPEKVADLLEEVDPDFLVLEEIDSRWVEALSGEFSRYPHQVVHPRADNFGIGLFSKFPLSDEKVIFPGMTEVPTILATVSTGEGSFQICATHPLPPTCLSYSRKRDDQLASLSETLSSSLPVLLMGDLNTSPWGHAFRRLKKDSGLLDSASGFGIQPSWPAGNFLLRIPIDHALHSPEIRVQDRRICPDVGSDHFALIFEFTVHID